MLFVVGTMALSVVVSSAGAAIASLMHGNAEAAGGALVMGLVGGTMVFGPMLLIGFLPSLIAFALVYWLAGGAAALRFPRNMPVLRRQLWPPCFGSP